WSSDVCSSDLVSGVEVTTVSTPLRTKERDSAILVFPTGSRRIVGQRPSGGKCFLLRVLCSAGRLFTGLQFLQYADETPRSCRPCHQHQCKNGPAEDSRTEARPQPVTAQPNKQWS